MSRLPPPRSEFSRREFLAGVAAGGALIMLHPFSAHAATNQAHLRIMETTDIHVNLLPYDYYADKANDTMGLSRTASLIDAVRKEATNSMLIDNGDLLQGSPMGDYVAYEKGMKDGDLHPVMKGMNLLGYECSTLGNHEFNYGLSFLDKVLAGANFPFVCANLIRGTTLASNPRDDKLYLKPYVILDRKIKDGSGTEQPIRIGVIGFVPPQIMVWDLKNLEGNVQTRDIVEAAKAWVPQIREEGADIVIALSHSGIDIKQGDKMENASFFVAGVEGIDAVFTGHQHLVFPGKKDFQSLQGVDTEKGTLQGKPAVMGGFWGSHMGLIDLLLERDGSKWRVVSATAEARPIYERVDNMNKAKVGDDKRIIAALEQDHQATLAYVRRPVGKTSAPLYSYFALVADDPSVQIVNQAQSWYLKDILKSTKWKDVPLLSAAAPFKAGGRNGADYYTDVPAGDIAIKNVADLYLYPNTVRAVEIAGAEVREWLEMSAGIFNHIEPGKADQPLINTDFPSYNFDVIDGVTYKIDLSQPPKYDAKGSVANAGSNRIVDLKFDGNPIDPAAKFVVATNNYRAGGGGNFPDINASRIIYEAPDTNRDVIVRYVVSEGTINPSADDNWSFAPMPGASVVFETGPRAKDFIAEVKSLKIEPAGDGEAGFAKYRITL
ncbi:MULTISPECIES: bifunctional 2',3'-cyclic-nucleotide 2'-phosphodiesterase/3'-nucleotidase [unclassified Mesorhizobium]|uniref:bifunctional 2',3'-cyclic-nucleotide 2'-phosphodiesterase/3'-nucleotidase n=1 Tax=unclassified Mesorhizobium TaxID=325217 RepID=UPI000FDA3556|nr:MULTISPECIES: bifunctional 2',3'-cyclic-nucleotide 2'-phosphodiesterase/3'-nucleotidase [unclassified Mesorhizobium]TGQ08950.1 bifunctional 2',3'-cyclic-nucleotide 2'-phosphodiesterase/3'-nucleotidase [Mesorhizobium sp. M2E.F.Ca.ET.219.01.1.1]TGT69485.1 bifunctional 2',3'-cyclic-nucleotide 2'-phosphodiesterase/3'-nucleotidase [Mesorhizobium sp. M2E.F.Ca.ET.166.01.1.1]TGW01817.1 bifunctional 2',3'-cyclic-nucleotide 2'-phosphodiesterase/3'-nucleotidase [Mesorhizobium sp. M2E.F.Ca.ET.154.01.1.1]